MNVGIFFFSVCELGVLMVW